jgi:methionyl-tRNA formyltransferase
MIKVVIFGCQQIAVDFIEYLLSRQDIEITLIVTYELPLDKVYGYESVLEKAGKWGLRVINPPRINREFIDEIEKLSPDIVFSIYYRKIFPLRLLKIPRQGCVNIHPSLLPQYRGPVPTAWAMLNGEKEFGITIHQMDRGIDTGAILIQKRFSIFEEETGFQLYTRAMTLGAKLLKASFDQIIRGELKPRAQKGSGSYYGSLTDKYIIDWRQKAEDILNIVRVHAKPYNPSETKIFNRYVLINRVSVCRNERYRMQGAGVIVDILERERLVVSCADGCLILEDYEIVPYLNELERQVYLKVGNRFEL